MERLAHRLEPFLPSLPPLADRAIGGERHAVEYGAGEKIGSFQGSDVTLTGGFLPSFTSKTPLSRLPPGIPHHWSKYRPLMLWKCRCRSVRKQ